MTGEFPAQRVSYVENVPFDDVIMVLRYIMKLIYCPFIGVEYILPIITHSSFGDVAVILKVYFSHAVCGKVTGTLFVKLLVGESHKTD